MGVYSTTDRFLERVMWRDSEIHSLEVLLSIHIWSFGSLTVLDPALSITHLWLYYSLLLFIIVLVNSQGVGI